MRKLALTVCVLGALLVTEQGSLAQYMGGNYQAPYQAPAQPMYQTQYRQPQNYSRTGFGGTYNNAYSGFNSVGQNRQSTYTRPPQVPATPSNSTMQNLEQQLNAIDTRNAWARTPAATAAPRAQPQGNAAYSSGVPGYGGTQSPRGGGMMPGITRRDIARVFFEGGSIFDGGAGGAAPAPSAGSSEANSTAYSSYQRAENMATRARNAEWRTTGDNDKWNKKKAADEAYYDANDADAAANRAYYAAQNGDSQAQGYARLARQAADRARADANRARYNADTAR